ncbi:MAG TPA: ABC transporter permease [Dehalococcoidia bacterium]
MKDVVLALRQVRYENRAFWRNPPAAFFAFVFPLLFLVILNLLFGNDTISVEGGEVSTSTFYVPSIAALSIINACYTGLAQTIVFARDEGQLKRVRGTPLPAWAFLAGRVLHLTLVGILLVGIVVVFGAVFYDVDVPVDTLPAFAASVATGAAVFSTLGLALSGLIPNADAAPAVVNASILPLLFISDIFIPLQDPPAWLDLLGDLFPVKHFSEALQTAFNPFQTGSGFEPAHLLVMAVWGVAGAVVALRTFSWEPRR